MFIEAKNGGGGTLPKDKFINNLWYVHKLNTTWQKEEMKYIHRIMDESQIHEAEQKEPSTKESILWLHL